MGELVVDGVRLTYEVHGAGPPVLLICGTGMSSQMWGFTTLPPLLDAGYQVVTFDNRGIPPSDVPPPPYSVEAMAGDAIALLEHLQFGPVAAMGVSLGGTILQHAALQRPDLIGAAIFMVGVGRVSAVTVAMIKGMRELLGAEMDLHPAVFSALMAPALVAPPRYADRDAVDTALALAAAFLPSERDGLLGQYEANLAWATGDHLDELEQLAMPALAIAAEYCTAFPPADVKAAVARMPDARYVELPGAPHVPLDAASNELIASSLLTFLADHHPSLDEGPGR